VRSGHVSAGQLVVSLTVPCCRPWEGSLICDEAILTLRGSMLAPPTVLGRTPPDLNRL